jgi:hypothetical protein
MVDIASFIVLFVRGSTPSFFFDLNEGVCYIYIPGVLTPELSIIDVFKALQKDARIPSESARLFERNKEFIHDFRNVVEKQGFAPYRIEGDLETVRVTAEGDLESNPDWKHLEGSIDIGKWRTIAFVQYRSGRPFVFGAARQRQKEFTFPSSDDYDLEQIVSIAIEVRTYIEKAIGQDIRQYLFPELPLTEFFSD